MWRIIVFLLLTFPNVLWCADRVVSLSPQVTESVFLLNAGDLLIAVTDLCSRPLEALNKERIGKPLTPDIEKIVSLKPDLVLASREGNPPWTVERLRRMGLKVRYFPRPGNLDGLIANFINLGKDLNQEKKAGEIVDYAQRLIRSTEKSPPKRLVWQVGADPLVVASVSSIANDMVRLAGGINVIETSAPYPRLNREEVFAKKPDVIVLMDMGYNVELEQERWKRHLPETRFIVMDSYIVGSPTPITFAIAVRRLSEALRGKS